MRGCGCRLRLLPAAANRHAAVRFSVPAGLHGLALDTLRLAREVTQLLTLTCIRRHAIDLAAAACAVQPNRTNCAVGLAVPEQLPHFR